MLWLHHSNFRQQLLSRQRFHGSAFHLAVESSGVRLLWNSNESTRKFLGSATGRFRMLTCPFFSHEKKTKKNRSQLLQRGVVTRRAAAAAGLKVEDQVREKELVFFFAFASGCFIYRERAACTGGGWGRNRPCRCALGRHQGAGVKGVTFRAWRRGRWRRELNESSSKTLARQLLIAREDSSHFATPLRLLPLQL